MTAQQELQAVRAAHPDCLVVRLNHWPAPDAIPDTALLAVPKLKRPQAEPEKVFLLALTMTFGVDEFNLGSPPAP